MSETTNENPGQPGDVGNLLQEVDAALLNASNYPGLGPVVEAVAKLSAAVAALSARVA